MDKSDCIVSLLSPIFNLSSHFCLLPSILITFHFFLLTSPFLFSQTPEWVYQYVNPQSTEYPYAITVDSIGNTYTTGCIFIGTSRGLGVIHLDYTGTNGWVYFNDTLGVGETGYDIIFAFNRIYLVGETGNDDLIVACIDTLGSELWLYCDTFASCGYAIGVSESHHIYVAGIKYPSPPDWVVVKLDSLGNLCWRYVYDGPAGSYDEASSIVIDGNENIYVGGYSTGLGTAEDFTVIKLDSAGQEQWVYRYDGPASYNDAGGV
ncbi:MAG: SBBP repeat-containing protein, partial [candidate division WOR-3 bacterium]